jgi:hypothetical protein
VIRFSTVAGERGSPDSWRDPHGFALKFYTTKPITTSSALLPLRPPRLAVRMRPVWLVAL